MTGLFSVGQRSLTFSTMTVIGAAAYNNLSVSAALPAIGDDLGNLEFLPWVITIELITSAIAVLAVGPVIDSLGTRVVFRASLVAFVVACIACAAAPTMLMLVIARALQGLTTGAIIANVMAAIGLGVPDALRARSYAANSSVWGVMGLAGPAVAAGVLTVTSWQGIFLVNIPVAALAAVVGWNRFPGPADLDRPKSISDRRGIAIATAFTLVSLTALSSLTWWIVPGVLAAAALVGVYIAHERRTDEPVLRLHHLTDPRFRLLHAVAFLIITSGITSNAFLPVYVKAARGASTTEAAFSVVFLTIGWTTGAFITSRISEIWSGERAVLVGTTALAVSATIAATAISTNATLYILFAAFIGIGMGLGGVSSAGLGVLQSQARPTEMGRVNSAHQFMRTLGFTYGAALGGVLLFGVVELRLGDADVVRDLLGDEEVVVAPSTVDAISAGFTWSAVAAAVISYAALATAVRLQRSTAPLADLSTAR